MVLWEPLSGQRSPDRLDARVWAITDLMLGGDDVFDYADSEFVMDPIEIPEHWFRVYALDIDTSRASCLWGALDKDTDELYIYGERVIPRNNLALILEYTKKNGGLLVPALFDHKAHGRKDIDGRRLIDALLDLNLNLLTFEGSPEAEAAEVENRLATKRIKVFNTCREWIGQFRAYRRGRDGGIIEGNDGLMRALGLLALSGPMLATSSNEKADDAAYEDWVGSRDPLTGY